MKTSVAVLFGGKSVEHEISVISAIQALHSINQEAYDVIPIYITKKNEMYMGDDIGDIEAYKDIDALLKRSRRVFFISEDSRTYIEGYQTRAFQKHIKVPVDIAFPIVHGTNVEDGALQGYLKTLNLPFVGCDVTSSAVCMDKYLSKLVVKDAGVPVLDGCKYTYADYENIEKLLDDAEKNLSYPMIVKPINLGSSVGIGVAKDRAELTDKIDDAFSYAKQILIEHAITNLREINCSVLGDNDSAIPSVCEEPLHTDEILSYEDKYMSNNSKSGSKGMASVSRKIPADLPEESVAFVQEMAVKAFLALNCAGVARIDFLLDADTGKIYFNEINTIPGSLAFYLWEAAGVGYPELLDRLIALSLKRFRDEERLAFSFDTNILSNNGLSGAKGVKK